MCSRYVTIVSIILLLLNSYSAKATHIYGGELLYTHITGDTYRITLTLYGDCSGDSYPALANASPSINIFNGAVAVDTIYLSEDTLLRKEVSPVCPDDVNKTSCKSATGVLPGVTRLIYYNTVTLPPSANWLLAFSGQMNKNNTRAGRSGSITNISFTASGSIMYLEATLNNLNGPNSSPQYTSIPTPFFCINKSQQYNQGAVDGDNDSLGFSLIPALVNNSTQVSYVSVFTGATPLATIQGTFNFNVHSGQMAFVPDQLQRSLVVNKVEEYKNGVMVGSSMREMTFIVIDYCHNTPPKGDIDPATLVGGGVIDNVVNVCVNTPDLTFKIPANDIDTDDITITLNNIPNGATATITANNSHTPVVNFSWNTQNVPVGTYNMYITYTDNACPLYGSQTMAYTIRVVNPITIAHEVIQPTNCIFREHARFTIKEGILPRQITIRNNSGDIISTFTDLTGEIIDSFQAGNYTIQAESEALKCKTSYRFTVKDSGTYPIPPVAKNLDPCINDEVKELEVIPVNGSAIIKWYTEEGAHLPSAPTYETKMARAYRWLVSQQVGICESATGEVSVTVHDFPVIKVQNTPQRICSGDEVILTASGGVKYEWTPGESVEYSEQAAFTHVKQPTTYYVKGYDEFGCVNIDSVTYDDIEQCCTFSYPDAFTPNNDGINDSWRPVIYGNVEHYRLSVYNRWGQRVFTTTDPAEKWKGTFGGKDLGMDTYHFSLRATCVTGPIEVTKGSFILIR